MKPAMRTKLIRILGLLGSDVDGERASAALAAHRLVEASGESWKELLQPGPITRTVIRRVRDYDVNAQEAADARMRQLRATNERLEREVRALRTRVTNLAEARRRERAEEDLEAD